MLSTMLFVFGFNKMCLDLFSVFFGIGIGNYRVGFHFYSILWDDNLFRHSLLSVWALGGKHWFTTEQFAAPVAWTNLCVYIAVYWGTHTNGTSRLVRKLIFGMQSNINQTRRNMMQTTMVSKKLYYFKINTQTQPNRTSTQQHRVLVTNDCCSKHNQLWRGGLDHYLHNE
jgi:hypothetical protein